MVEAWVVWCVFDSVSVSYARLIHNSWANRTSSSSLFLFQARVAHDGNGLIRETHAENPPRAQRLGPFQCSLSKSSRAARSAVQFDGNKVEVLPPGTMGISLTRGWCETTDLMIDRTICYPQLNPHESPDVPRSIHGGGRQRRRSALV